VLGWLRPVGSWASRSHLWSVTVIWDLGYIRPGSSDSASVGDGGNGLSPKG
jgi:hypothetical protein